MKMFHYHSMLILKRKFGIVVAMIIFIPIFAMADYHYVNLNGTDEYPYDTWDTGAWSINEALQPTEPFDTLYIGAGSYNELVRMYTGDSCITVIGAGIDSTRIWTSVLNDIWYFQDKTTFINIYFQHLNVRLCIRSFSYASFTVENCKFSGGSAIESVGGTAIIRNCIFENVDEAVDIFIRSHLIFENNYCIERTDGYCWIYGDLNSGIINNNIFIANDYTWMAFNDINSDISDSIIIRNNYMYNPDNGPIISGARKAEISNNIIQGVEWEQYHASYGLGVYNNRDSADIKVINNVISSCERAVNISIGNYSGCQVEFSYNCLWANDTDFNSYPDDSDSIGNISAFPMYVNPDSHDVHLQAYSPLIDAGDPDILDADGTRSDIGVFGGPRGASYQYLDLPPSPPKNPMANVWNGNINLTWEPNIESDFDRYVIYKDTLSGFIPDTSNIIAQPVENYYLDVNWDSFHNYYYRLAAMDNQGNIGTPTQEIQIINVGIRNDPVAELPSITVIESNYPNPFNSSTAIIYSVANLGPMPAQVNIDIYDIGGRKVRSLLDNREEAGKRTVIWDGKDDMGRELTSGVYFVKTSQWHVGCLSKSQKLVLIR